MTKTRSLKKLGFLHIVPFERDAAADGLERALEIFRFGERIGLDGGWIRTRHVQYGVPSAAVFLAAAAQRTSRIDLGTAVIPTAYESPLRLAEDLSTADLLSGGRLQAGLSTGAPKHPDHVADAILGPNRHDDDLSYARIERILGFIRGDQVDSAEREIGFGGVVELSSDRIEPHSPGLASRIWYGGGSLRSAEWAARAGLKLLVSNISTAENSDVFEVAQREQIDLFRASHPLGDAAIVSQGRVLLPTDNATQDQRERFRAYADARTPRTLTPVNGRVLIAPDIIGSTDEIVDRLLGDSAFDAVDEFLFELPFQFDDADTRHIMREVTDRIGPALGWTPSA